MLPFLTIITVAVMMLLGTGTDSTPTTAKFETRVGILAPTMVHVVGVPEHIAAGQRLGSASP